MDSENSRLKTLSLQRCTCISTAERNCFVAWEIKYLCCYKMQPWENIKSHKSCKRYGLKTSTSDEVRQGCLHFFPITKPLAEICEMHQQPVWPTKIILRLLAGNLSTTANQLSATSVLIQQNQHGDCKQNDMASFAEALYKAPTKLERNLLWM